MTTVRGDLTDAASLKAALRGAEKLFLLSSAPRFDGVEIAAIEAAKASGVRHVVKLSAMGALADGVSPLMRAHARVERALEESGLAFTILRPTFFMQNWVAFYSHADQGESAGLRERRRRPPRLDRRPRHRRRRRGRA